MAHSLAVRPADGQRTWTVIDEKYRTVAPVEDWLEAHRQLWSPNTVRGYATSLAQWWTFLEQRGRDRQVGRLGVPAVAGFLSWLRNGRTVEHALVAPEQAPAAGDIGGEAGRADLLLPLAGGGLLGAGRGPAHARGTAPGPGPGPAGAPGRPHARRARRRWCGCGDQRHAAGRRCCCPSEMQAILDGCAMLGRRGRRLGGEPARPAAVRPARGDRDAAGRGAGHADQRLRDGPRRHSLCRDRAARGQPERGQGEDDASPPGLCRRRPGAAVRRLPHPSRLPGRRVRHRDLPPTRRCW